MLDADLLKRLGWSASLVEEMTTMSRALRESASHVHGTIQEVVKVRTVSSSRLMVADQKRNANLPR
jgi:hypothetical protein